MKIRKSTFETGCTYAMGIFTGINILLLSISIPLAIAAKKGLAISVYRNAELD